ncbi:MAG: AraC family transcriptional regulator [Firmicutes bacterium]|nr:AraC family transcriptional regulator [Bacillota bacterium]
MIKERTGGNTFHFDRTFYNEPQIYDFITLYQIGDLYCRGGYSIGEHKQYCYEISYIVSGKGYYSSNENKYPVKAGDIYLNMPGELHNGLADLVDPFRYFYVGFTFNNDNRDQSPFTHIQKMFYQVKCPVVQDKFDIKTPFLNIFHELINLKEYSSLMIKICLHQLILLTYRNFFEQWEKEYIPHKDASNYRNIVYEVVNYIDNNLFKIKELTQIANELGYSYSYLSHIFSRETGLSIQEYYNQKRFEKAGELLKNGNLSVTEIAEMLQYQSINSFSKAFRKNIGISPSEYQALYSKNKS